MPGLVSAREDRSVERARALRMLTQARDRRLAAGVGCAEKVGKEGGRELEGRASRGGGGDLCAQPGLGISGLRLRLR